MDLRLNWCYGMHTQRGLLDPRLNWYHGIHIKRVTAPQVELVSLDSYTNSGPEIELVSWDARNAIMVIQHCQL